MDLDKYKIFDNLIEGVQIIDSQFNYVYVNEAVAVHGKVSREELQGFNMMEKYPGIENTQVFQLIKSCLENKERNQLINEFDFPDGSKGYFELRIQNIEEGVIVFSFDVTDVVLAKKIVESTNEKLEEQVAERTQELDLSKKIIEQQVKQLLELNKSKDKFFSIIAHDLRSPLDSLFSACKMLEEQIDEFEKEEIVGLSGELKALAANTIKLTDNLLTWAQIQMQNISTTPEHVSLRDVIEECIELYTPEAKRKKLKVYTQIETENVVYADRNQIVFVIRNLLNNAIKYCEDQNHIYFKTYLQAGWVCLDVEDNGVGMTNKTLDALFGNKKVTSNAGTDGEMGTGLGLLLVSDFLHMNNATITVSSERGKGSCFQICFHGQP